MQGWEVCSRDKMYFYPYILYFDKKIYPSERFSFLRLFH